MGSVNLNDGTGWWKRCMRCGEWTNYDDLRYEPPSDQHPYGLDLCPTCDKGCAPQAAEGMMLTLLLPKEES